MKIVVVDDEMHIRSLLEQTLEELEDDYDVEIHSAANGKEGLELIQSEMPELVFLDVMMPLMNGYDVCEAVRADAKLSGTKIVLLTAKGQETDRKRGLDAGANEYMTKPFDPDEVVELAKMLLGLS